LKTRSALALSEPLRREQQRFAIASSGRFFLATNITDKDVLSAEQVLLEYKEQQSPERRFRFLIGILSHEEANNYRV